jgi:hypothetical protein
LFDEIRVCIEFLILNGIIYKKIIIKKWKFDYWLFRDIFSESSTLLLSNDVLSFTPWPIINELEATKGYSLKNAYL